jgi:hypothetical protein
MIDQAKKKALIEHIKQRETPDRREILLAPDVYFNGYDDKQCSICANIGAIPTSQFAARLRDIQQRPDVEAVFVRFYEYDDALEFNDSWIGSDSIYLVTNASLDTIRHWFSGMEPSDIGRRLISPGSLMFLIFHPVIGLSRFGGIKNQLNRRSNLPALGDDARS